MHRLNLHQRRTLIASGMRGLLTLATLVASLLLLASCSGAPSAPGPLPQGVRTALVPAPTAAASLVIQRTSVLVYPQQGGDAFGYEPRNRTSAQIRRRPCNASPIRASFKWAG